MHAASATREQNETMTERDLGWFALLVKSRHEFITRDELLRKGIEPFLPSVLKLQQWRDRKKRVEFPVFPGYLFVHIAPHPEAFLQVVKTRGTVSLVSLVPGYPTPVANHEIDGLKKVVASGQPFDVYPGYRVGTRVRIRRGPLQGAEGVIAKKEELLFFVNVEILGRSVAVRIDAGDVELISGV